jgi:hypothetical protein
MTAGVRILTDVGVRSFLPCGVANPCVGFEATVPSQFDIDKVTFS